MLPSVFFFFFIFREIIRRKAVLALYKFYLIAPNQVQHIHDKFRKALCDKDPDVMAASLHIYGQMIKVGSGETEHKCSKQFEKYHSDKGPIYV